mgnify:CR=1 FL=1
MELKIFKGVLNRKEFIIRMVLFWTISLALFYVLHLSLRDYFEIRTFLITKSIIAVGLVLIITPVIVKRLRDIEWPIWLSIIFFLSTAINLKNLILADISIPLTSMTGLMLLDLASLIVFLFLLFKKGSSSNVETTAS